MHAYTQKHAEEHRYGAYLDSFPLTAYSTSITLHNGTAQFGS